MNAMNWHTHECAELDSIPMTLHESRRHSRGTCLFSWYCKSCYLRSPTWAGILAGGTDFTSPYLCVYILFINARRNNTMSFLSCVPFPYYSFHLLPGATKSSPCLGATNILLHLLRTFWTFITIAPSHFFYYCTIAFIIFFQECRNFRQLFDKFLTSFSTSFWQVLTTFWQIFWQLDNFWLF
jgi:hypothetical protein